MVGEVYNELVVGLCGYGLSVVAFVSVLGTGSSVWSLTEESFYCSSLVNMNCFRSSCTMGKSVMGRGGGLDVMVVGGCGSVFGGWDGV